MTTTTVLAGRYVTTRMRLGELAPTTAKSQRYTLRSFVLRVPSEPTRITRRHVERWLTRLDVADSTKRTRLNTVRSFCQWMNAHGEIHRDPTVGINGPRDGDHLPRDLNPAEAAAVLTQAPDTRARLILNLVFHQAMRRAEIAHAQVGDVDLTDEAMLVRGKGRRERYLPIAEPTLRALHAYFAEFPITSGPLIRSYHDPYAPVTPDHLGRLVSTWMYAAGVKKRPWDGKSAHAGRHTRASDLLEDGADVREVQEVLGHVHLGSTQVYLRRPGALRLRRVLNSRSYVDGGLRVSSGGQQRLGL